MGRSKKPPVDAEHRREWLRLVEEEGWTPTQIAEKYFYDVRTVRKALQWARDERERREARVIVFRRALENHYNDLVSFVAKIDSEIAKELAISPLTRSERLWSALRQHLPRSPLWKLVNKLETTNEEIRGVHNELRQKIAKISLARVVPRTEEMGLNREAVEGALVDRAMTSHGEGSLQLEARQSRQEHTEIAYGDWNCAIVPNEKAGDTQDYISSLMDEVAALPTAQQLRELLEKRQEIKGGISEELAVIRLKRIVPGRCKYCPL